MRGRRTVALVLAACSVACNRDPSEPAPPPPPPETGEREAPEPEPEPSPTTARPEPQTEPQAEPEPTPPDAWLAGVLDPLRPEFDGLLDDPAHYRFQILVTEVAPNGKDVPPTLTEHGWRVDAEYVYPASAIKTYASVTALRKLQTLREEHGKRIDVDTPLAFCHGRSTRCRSTDDDTNVETGLITLRQEIRKMQLVSNNTAFNRLVQFVGMDAMNADVRGMGFESFRLHHPLWVGSRPEDPVDAQVELRPERGKKVVIPARDQTLADMPPPPFADMLLGEAWLDDDNDKQRVDEPMDFSAKNYVSIRDFHRLTMAIARPELADVPDLNVPDLGLDEPHQRLLRGVMLEDPLDSKNPVYTDEKKGALRYKTLLRGMSEVRDPKYLRYLNKAGRAFGFHLENAWIQDRKSKREVFVTVVLYVNDDGLLNDDRYGYDAISRPLFVALGESLAKAAFAATG